eukprot:382447_1
MYDSKPFVINITINTSKSVHMNITALQQPLISLPAATCQQPIIHPNAHQKLNSISPLAFHQEIKRSKTDNNNNIFDDLNDVMAVKSFRSSKWRNITIDYNQIMIQIAFKQVTNDAYKQKTKLKVDRNSTFEFSVLDRLPYGRNGCKPRKKKK